MLVAHHVGSRNTAAADLVQQGDHGQTILDFDSMIRHNPLAGHFCVDSEHHYCMEKPYSYCRHKHIYLQICLVLHLKLDSQVHTLAVSWYRRPTAKQFVSFRQSLLSYPSPENVSQQYQIKQHI